MSEKLSMRAVIWICVTNTKNELLRLIAPGAIINGKLNFENTANFGEMIHTDRSNWRYRPAGEL